MVDRQTRLAWTASDNGSDVNWKDAQAHCQRLQGAWQLPSVDELMSLYDDSGALTATCGQLICKVSPLFRLTGNWFWSREPEGSQARNVHLVYGARRVFNVDFTRNGRALCVQRS